LTRVDDVVDLGLIVKEVELIVLIEGELQIG
jgi:hypothetical protein